MRSVCRRTNRAPATTVSPFEPLVLSARRIRVSGLFCVWSPLWFAALGPALRCLCFRVSLTRLLVRKVRVRGEGARAVQSDQTCEACAAPGKRARFSRAVCRSGGASWQSRRLVWLAPANRGTAKASRGAWLRSQPRFRGGSQIVDRRSAGRGSLPYRVRVSPPGEGDRTLISREPMPARPLGRALAR